MMDGGWVHDIEKSEVTILEGVFFWGAAQRMMIFFVYNHLNEKRKVLFCFMKNHIF